MQLESLATKMNVDQNWYAFARAVNKINTEGFYFNKIAFLADCKRLGEYVGSEEHYNRYVNSGIPVTVTLEQLKGFIADDAALINFVDKLCQGKDEQYYQQIKKQYFEEEEGSMMENVYATIYKEQQKYLNGTIKTDLLSKYCVDSIGNVKLDAEHLRFMIEVIHNLNERPQYNWSKTLIHDITADFQLLSDYMRVNEFYNMPYVVNTLIDSAKVPKSEFAGIKGYIKHSTINPNFRRDKNLGISWPGCRQIIKDYVMTYVVPEGYTGYYYYRQGLAYTIFLATMLETDLITAKKEMANITEGCIYSCLSKQYEEENLRRLLSGDYSNFDGVYGKKLTDWYLSDTSEGALCINDFYTVEVAPIMQVMLGEALGEIERLNATDKGNVAWIRDDVFVVIVKDGEKLSDVVGEKYEKFYKRVPNPNMSLILNDKFHK